MADEEKTETEQPQTVKVWGREFDVSTPEGRSHLESFGEGTAFKFGKQSNELGELRPLKALAETSEDDEKFKSEMSNLLESEDPEERRKAADLILTRDKVLQERQKRERENDRIWSKYFSERPQLTSKAKSVGFSEEDLRIKAERDLGSVLFEAKNQSQALDSFFQFEKVAEKAEPSDDGTQVVQTSSRTQPKKVEKEEDPQPSFTDIVTERSKALR